MGTWRVGSMRCWKPSAISAGGYRLPWGMSRLFRLTSPGRHFQKSFITSRSAWNNEIGPLRILFCGADTLSGISLEALHREGQEYPGRIASIDVVCRPGKRAGRGLKEIRHPPIKNVAEQLGLPVHQINTFTGWNLPRHGLVPSPSIDLIIAVSFGLFVPPRILKASKYGGINVHPSLLPEFQGPAPLHWTILSGQTRTGVTLQTLDPLQFDHGVILDQTPYPGVEMPNPTSYSYKELLDMSASMAAEMLVKAIRNRVFVPPYKDIRQTRNDQPAYKPSIAPKITRQSRMIDFQNMDRAQILRMNRAIPPLWAKATTASGQDGTSIIFEPSLHAADTLNPSGTIPATIRSIECGLPYAFLDKEDQIESTSVPLMINTKDELAIIVPEIKLSGTPNRPAAALAWSAGLLAAPLDFQNGRLYKFHRPLEISTEA